MINVRIDYIQKYLVVVSKCPCTRQTALNTAGIVSSVKCVSLKHSVLCNLSVVLETYTENPRKDALLKYDVPVMEKV